MLPNEGAVRYGGWCSFFAYIAHFSQKSKLYGRSKANFWHALVVKFQSLVNILKGGRPKFEMGARCRCAPARVRQPAHELKLVLTPHMGDRPPVALGRPAGARLPCARCGGRGRTGGG